MFHIRVFAALSLLHSLLFFFQNCGELKAQRGQVLNLASNAVINGPPPGPPPTPLNNVWTPLTQVNPPAARYAHSAVWTGTRMIIFGGVSGANQEALNDGFSLDPQSGQWTAISSVNAPSARSGHSAVWTGNRMIVWGGSSLANGLRGDGAIYDPATDTWSAMSATLAPSARFGHGSAWIAGKMIIWGGTHLNGTTNVTTNTGALYDLATNTWSPFTGVLPAGRTGLSSTANGTSAMFWGGSSTVAGPAAGTNSILFYNPLINLWSSLQGIGSPSARTLHSAVWTGSKMVIWGGQGPGLLATGSVYESAAQSWSPTSTVGAPSARQGHSAIWTGTQMLIWGGAGAGGTALNTGALYD